MLASSLALMAYVLVILNQSAQLLNRKQVHLVQSREDFFAHMERSVVVESVMLACK